MMTKIIKEIVPESAVIKPTAPDFCKHPETLDNMEVEYERECKVNNKGEKVSCKVVATVVTVGRGTASEKVFRIEKPLSSSEVVAMFKERCSCGCTREYDIHF